MVVLTAPLISGLVVPLVLLDLAVSRYQAVCFPVCGIARVRRRDHIVIDWHRLACLNAVEKLDGVDCGHARGLISHVREIAARTEHYWCPIKHSRRAAGLHDRHPDVVDHGDAEGWHGSLPALRRDLRGPGA